MSVASDQKPRGRVVTFYSYKGGVGRSMAAANVGALLSKWGKRVLLLDWDLEAPGLEKYFDPEPRDTAPRVLSEQRRRTPGLADLVHAFEAGQPFEWRSCVLSCQPFAGCPPVSLITAGRDDEGYTALVRGLNWERLFEERGFGTYLEKLRREWISEFDYVLVDSRTGITDVGGVCTIHLPDILVVMFTANEQSLGGAKRVMQEARQAHERLPLDRFRLQIVPLPGRDESLTEHEMARKWREIFAAELGEFYQTWVPPGVTPRDVLERLKLPYKAYWSFGERLPVVAEGTSDPSSLGYAFAILGRLIQRDLAWGASLDADARVELESTRAQEAHAAAAVATARAAVAEVRARRTRKTAILVTLGLTLAAALALGFNVMLRKGADARSLAALRAAAAINPDPVEASLLWAEVAARATAAGEPWTGDVPEIAVPLWSFAGPRPPVNAVLSSDGKSMYWTSAAGFFVRPLDVKGAPTSLGPVEAGRYKGAELRFAPDGKHVRVAPFAGGESVDIWTLGLPEPQRLLGTVPPSVRFTGDSAALVTIADDKESLRMWDLEGRPLKVARLTGPSTPFTLQTMSPLGKVLAGIGIGQAQSTVYLWAVGPDLKAEYQSSRELSRCTVRSLAVSDRTVAVSCRERSLVLFPVHGGGEVTVRPIDLDGVLAFSSEDGTYVFTAGSVGTSKGCWTGSGRCVELRDRNPILRTSFDAEARTALTVSSDGTIRAWRLPDPKSRPTDWNAFESRITALVPTCLLPAQRTQLLGETAEEGVVHFQSCERAHGREPAHAPAPEPTPPLEPDTEMTEMIRRLTPQVGRALPTPPGGEGSARAPKGISARPRLPLRPTPTHKINTPDDPLSRF